MTNVKVLNFGRPSQGRLRPGFCVDTGAPTSVIGLKELRRIFNQLGRRLPILRHSPKRFQFADASFDSLGKIDLPLATPAGIQAIFVTLDVVSADVPALLGLDILDSHHFVADTVSNRLVKRSIATMEDGQKYCIDDWSVPLIRAHAHIYADMRFPVLTFFTKQELSKLHRQFCHPSSDKLLQLLKKGRPNDVDSDTKKILDEIASTCDPCQRIQDGPGRFRVSIAGRNARFNEGIILDVMYLDGKPVLHLVDNYTHFSAARFLPDMSTNTIWETIVTSWASVYTGLPNSIRVDQGSQLKDSFITIGRASGVEVNRSGVEAHNALGIGERYHHPLRNTFRKLKIAYPKVSDSTLLSMSVKAMNDTLGPEGLVPSALVFGEYPSLRVFGETPQPKATVAARAILAKEARREMEQHMARLRIKRALKHNVPRAADIVYEVGQKVLVWREKAVNNRIGEWMGPYVVSGLDRDRKLVFVSDQNGGPPKPFGFAQIKPFFSNSESSNAFFVDLLESFQKYRSTEEPAVSPEDGQIFLTEVLDPRDERTSLPEMTEAKKTEIRSLLDRGTFKVILKEDIPPDGNVLPGRFVLAIKSTEDGEVKFKARYVIGGHRDRLKNMMVHSVQTLQPSSIRLLLALAAMHGFDVWTSDVRQAYLQSAVPLMRDIYIRDTVPEFELSPDQCLQLLKPLYGLCDSGDLWFKTLDDHHRNDLDMSPMRSDPALYAKMVEGMLKGLSGTYVDDMMRAGDQKFRKLARVTSEKFEMAEDETPPCTFTGFRLSKGADSKLEMNQDAYVSNLTTLPSDATFSNFASVRMKLAWLSHTRPDVLFEVSQLTQVTVDQFKENKTEIIRRTNRAVMYVKDESVAIKFPKLNLETLQVIGYSDASFCNNVDLTSQLGYIIFVGDGSGNVIPIQFKSYKARRVVRSAMAAELIGFADMFDYVFTLAEELRTLCPHSAVPVKLYTDNKGLFDIISKGTRTAEKRLMLDIAAAREGFRKHEISDIGLVRSEDNIADGLTKAMKQGALRGVVNSGRLVPKVAQWIVRTEPRS